MSSRVKKHLPMLRALSTAPPKVVKAVIKSSDPDLLRALCECGLNVLKGNVKLSPSQKKKLCRHKHNLRHLIGKKTSLKKKRIILQKGGFLGALLIPALSFLGSILK